MRAQGGFMSKRRCVFQSCLDNRRFGPDRYLS
jgi:hypothetical protein